MSGRPAVSRSRKRTEELAEAATSLDPSLQAFLRAVGKRIRLLRYQHELTQDDLAAATGISRAFISVIENGGHGMNLVRLYRLARALSVEPCELLRPPEKST
jgi:DNA-binding XRE family transcriptional regulator